MQVSLGARSGQVRVFNVHIQSKLSGTGKKRGWGGSKGDLPALASTSSPTGVGSRQRVFEVLWNLECPVGLSQICVHFNEGNLVSSVFEFSRLKVAQIGPSRC